MKNIQMHNLSAITEKKKKIIGRGYGSGKGGHTVGRGSKGQKARAGGNISLLFEGGQNPLNRRIPHKKGFSKHIKETIEIIKLDALNILPAGEEASAVDLVKIGLIRGIGTPKVLNSGDIKKKIILVNIRCSKSVKDKIEKQGGSVLWK